MKHCIFVLIALLCASSALGQTVKSLGFNTTNGYVVGPTNGPLIFTNGWIGTGTNGIAFLTNVGIAHIQTGPNVDDAGLQLTSYNVRFYAVNAGNPLHYATLSASNGLVIEADGTSEGYDAIGATRTNLGLGGGITATNTFVDLSTNTNTVTISNGIITGWTITP